MARRRIKRYSKTCTGCAVFMFWIILRFPDVSSFRFIFLQQFFLFYFVCFSSLCFLFVSLFGLFSVLFFVEISMRTEDVRSIFSFFFTSSVLSFFLFRSPFFLVFFFAVSLAFFAIRRNCRHRLVGMKCKKKKNRNEKNSRVIMNRCRFFTLRSEEKNKTFSVLAL